MCMRARVLTSMCSGGGENHSRKKPDILASTSCKKLKFYKPAPQQAQCWEKFDLWEGGHSVKTKGRVQRMQVAVG